MLGGSIIGTSRFKILEERGDIERILANLRREGIDGLVSIGGEGTLQLADRLRRAGIRIVHVPKTIDNDIAGVGRTFGFSTAAHEAARMLTAIKMDAQASDNWFVVEIMGRFTGHLALEAGLAAGCTRVLIPEDGPIDVDSLLTLIDTRNRCGRHWGVILAAESANFGDGHVMRYGRLGGIADALAERLDSACAEREIPCSIRTSNLGYFLRCAQPTGFDRAYVARLGLGAGRFILDPQRSGQMVTVVDDHLVGVPMEPIAGKVKYVDRSGISYQALQAAMAYESAGADLVENQRAWQSAHDSLHWLDRHTDVETIEKLAMRLGVPPESLLDALHELKRVESGEAEAADASADSQ
jgi:6-phosphofructokinase 1